MIKDLVRAYIEVTPIGWSIGVERITLGVVSGSPGVPTIEAIIAAAYSLCRRLDLLYADGQKECQRIHEADEIDTFVKDTVSDIMKQMVLSESGVQKDSKVKE